MDHETITYKTLITRALSTSTNCLTLSYKNWKIPFSIYCLQTTYLQCAILTKVIPELMPSCRPRLRKYHGLIQCVCACMCASG